MSDKECAHCPTRAKLDAMMLRDINRRVTVEQYLFDVVAGKLPPPNVEDLRATAIYLGTPEQAVPAFFKKPKT